MNAYTGHVLAQFRRSFVKRRFDQDDVALLLAVARDYTPQGGVLRELGDFLAHPDAKTKGLVFASVDQAAAMLERELLQIIGDSDHPRPVFVGLDLSALRSELESCLSSADGSFTVPADDLAFRDFIFCVVFLLSACRLMLDGRSFEFSVHYSNALTLSISYASQKVPTYRFVLPVIDLLNVCVEAHRFFMTPPVPLRGHIARRFGGSLAAIPYHLDLSAPTSLAGLPSGHAWPLPDFVLRQ